MIPNYKADFTRQKQHDPAQCIETLSNGYQFITTGGHGYLVVPTGDTHYDKALQIYNKGYCYRSPLAIYLEEDCAASEFIKAVK